MRALGIFLLCSFSAVIGYATAAILFTGRGLPVPIVRCYRCKHYVKSDSNSGMCRKFDDCEVEALGFCYRGADGDD